jgi:hypothetical protein
MATLVMVSVEDVTTTDSHLFLIHSEHYLTFLMNELLLLMEVCLWR